MKHVGLEMRINGEVDGGEWNVPHQTRCRSFVQSNDTQLSDDMDCAFLGLVRGSLRGLALHLQPNLHDLERVCEHDLTSTSGTTSNELPPELYPPRLRVRRTTTNKVIDGQLDCFLRGNTLRIGTINTP